jgi:LuxR family maltose regulon positive regulatory protein
MQQWKGCLPFGCQTFSLLPMTALPPDSLSVPPLPTFAHTKLHVPLLRRKVLPRARLMAQVQRAVAEARVLLVSAPAGSGKTTLLATVLAEKRPDKWVWVALDGNDNDLSQFLTLFIAASERLFDMTSVAARTLLDNGAPGERVAWGRQVLTALINDMVAADPHEAATALSPKVMVLDDVHVLHDPTIFAVLEYGIERLPPALMLMMATRHDPPLGLARLRARQDLVEIRLNELRFTVAEVEQLLNDRLGLEVSAAELTRLYERTEGWAAGLSLLAISLERLADGAERGHFLEHLAQTERFLFDYLAEEVLNLQEPATRTFLLESSILKELTPSLTQAVTGDPASATRLETLYRHNLFLTVLQQREDEPVYRYHDLFAEFLQSRLRHTYPLATWRTLHLRAALAEGHPARRMHHLLQAEAWEEAAHFLLDIGTRYIEHGGGDVVYGWIMALPDAILEQYPRLRLWLGQEAWQRMELPVAHQAFEQALAAFAAHQDPNGEGETLAHIAITQSLDEPFPRAEAIIQRALSLPLPTAQRVALLLNHALRLFFNGQWCHGGAQVDEAIRIAEAEPSLTVLRMLALHIGAPVTLSPGGIQRLARVLRLMERNGRSHDSQFRMDYLQIRAILHMGQGAWSQAQADCDAIYAITEPWGISPWRLMNIAAVTIRMPAIHARLLLPPDVGFNRILAFEQEATDNFTKGIAVFYLFHYVFSALQLGNVEEIADLIPRIMRFSHDNPQPDMAILERLLTGLLALHDGRDAEAETALQAAAAIQAAYPYTTVFGDALLLLAVLYLRMNRTSLAIEHLTPRLAYYEAEGAPGFCMWQGRMIVPVLQFAVQHGIHADFAREVLRYLDETVPILPVESAVAEKGGIHVPQTGQVLSVREVEVLGLLAEGANAGMIASQLIISPHTVRQHIKNLYNKLGVSSRAEATRYAVELGVV